MWVNRNYSAILAICRVARMASKRGRVDLLLNLDLIAEFFFHQTPLRVVQANF
jgi:hypothetical protein